MEKHEGNGGRWVEVRPAPEAVVFGPHDATNVDINGLFRIMGQLDVACAELTSFTTMTAPNTGSPNAAFPEIPATTSELLSYVDVLTRNIRDVLVMYQHTDEEQAAAWKQLNLQLMNGPHEGTVQS